MNSFIESRDLLQTIVSETEKSNQVAEQLVSGLTDDQLNWKPDESRWSIAQCLDHLTVTAHAWDEILTAAIARGSKKFSVKEPPPYTPSLVGGWLIKQVVPESKRKFQAPKVFRPTDASHIQNALQAFLASQQTFLDFVNSARGVDYNKTRLRSPVTPLMRYSLADAFVVSVVHNQRHLAQAARVKELPNFPAANKTQHQSA
jgi:DinB family protein